MVMLKISTVCSKICPYKYKPQNIIQTGIFIHYRIESVQFAVTINYAH